MFNQSFKNKFGFVSTTSLAVLSALLSSPAVQAMHIPDQNKEDMLPSINIPSRLVDQGNNAPVDDCLRANNLCMMGHSLLRNNRDCNFFAAFDFFKEAARLGNPDAQYQVGSMYSHIQKDEEALHYFELAADQNHPEALFTLGDMYDTESGGVYQNFVVAYNYFREAAAQGHKGARIRIGKSFLGG